MITKRLTSAIAAASIVITGTFLSAANQKIALSACTTPSTCGQVYKNGRYLYDQNGRWKVNGVMFILPQFGINGTNFWDGNYQSVVKDGSLEYWLGLAQNYLLAKTVRIFVDLPSGSNTPTSYATLYDFAQRANAHGMRVGFVLHNSGDFNMTPERRNWISGFINYFTQKNAKSLIAYVSADNEINNHYNGSDGYTNSGYLNGANNWVAQFASLFKGSGILVTVGISTEVRNTDSLLAINDFFKSDSSGRTLASLVDFISPHNYVGGGYGVIEQIRNKQYSGPVVLEEYGYSTDPKSPNHPDFTEGDPSCRNDPLQTICKNTAPYYVEVNAKSIRERDYAGGIAWMLADSNRKDCSSPGDFFTGLFAAGKPSDYCGGTYSKNPAQDKATAFRVRTHHYYY